MWDCRRSNKIKEAICKAEGIDENQKQEFAHLGERSPLFRYATQMIFHCLFADQSTQATLFELFVLYCNILYQKSGTTLVRL